MNGLNLLALGTKYRVEIFTKVHDIPKRDKERIVDIYHFFSKMSLKMFEDDQRTHLYHLDMVVKNIKSLFEAICQEDDIRFLFKNEGKLKKADMRIEEL